MSRHPDFPPIQSIKYWKKTLVTQDKKNEGCKLRSELKILTSDSEWVPVYRFTRYHAMYQKLTVVLEKAQGRGTEVEKFFCRHERKFKCPIQYEDFTTEKGELEIQILGIVSHRCGTAIFVSQYDSTTKGLRFLAYGTSFNFECDRGVGLDLNSVGTTTSLKYCPEEITARFVERKKSQQSIKCLYCSQYFELETEKFFNDEGFQCPHCGEGKMHYCHYNRKKDQKISTSFRSECHFCRFPQFPIKG